MVRVVEDNFGSAINPFNKQEEKIQRFTLTNENQMSVQVITLGATITSIKVPDANGCLADIALGYDDLAGFQTKTNPYFGTTVGRVCNRVANGSFCLDGREINVTKNLDGKHQLHGGLIGFDKAHWEVVGSSASGVSMQHCNPDGHEGYPGEVNATVHYTLTEDNCLHVCMEATSTQQTPVNLTNHSYFNLAGHAAGKSALYEHSIMLKADCYTETKDSIPTGQLIAVEGTAYDLRKLSNLGERLQKFEKGYDDNFCVNLQKGADGKPSTTMVAKAFHPPSGRWLEVATNQPGVQFYTSNNMPDTGKNEKPIIGKDGTEYSRQCSFCFETQKYPDAVNHPNFPSVILKPGEKYFHEFIYKFGVTRSQ